VVLLDTTVLSNLARIGRLDLLRLALPDTVTTPHVLAELEKGRQSGYLPAGRGDLRQSLVPGSAGARRLGRGTPLGGARQCHQR